jgi:hypothetical protein
MDRGAALNCRVVHNWQEPDGVVASEAEAVESEDDQEPVEES